MSIAGTGGHAPQLTSSSRDHKGCFSPRLPFQRIAVLLKDAHGPDGDLDGFMFAAQANERRPEFPDKVTQVTDANGNPVYKNH